MKKIYLLASVVMALFTHDRATAQIIELKKIGSYTTGVYDEGATEITAFDAATDRLFCVNGNTGNIDVLDLSDVTNPTLSFSIDLSAYGGKANSVAIKNGIVAAAVEDTVAQEPGQALFFDTDGNYLNAVEVGALPDMITFTPNGKRVLVANEGEPNDDYTIDPIGSVSIINIAGGIAGLTPANVTTVDFTAFDTLDLPEGVRVFGPGASPSMDLEPEYIAVSRNSKFAYVTLQEANTIAVINIQTGTVELKPLGYKDHSEEENAMDATDKNGGVVDITTWPVFGMYQPDAIEFFNVPAGNFLIMANEGDTRDYDGFSEVARVNSLVLDSIAFPDSLDLQNDNTMGRLYVTTTMGDTDADGDFDELYAFGGRSVSIRTTNGDLVWDSGSEIEDITYALYPSNFNCSHGSNTKKGRSDDKGPEPEGLTTAKILDSTYAFIGMERIGEIMVYNITNPYAPYFVNSINSRNFAETPGAGTGGDLGPEGLLFIPAAQSPNGRNLLVVAYEVSGSIAIYETDITCGPSQIQVCYAGTTYCVKPGTANALVAAGGSYGPCEDERFGEPLTLDAEQGIQIFPNPAHDQVLISLEGLTTGSVHIDLMNMSGEVVFSSTYHTENTSTSSVSVDLSTLPAGVYLVRSMQNSTILSTMLVKQ